MRILTSVSGGITVSTTLEITYIPPQMLEAITAARMPFTESFIVTSMPKS